MMTSVSSVSSALCRLIVDIIVDLVLRHSRHMCTMTCVVSYGLASISRLLKMIGLFCKRAL